MLRHLLAGARRQRCDQPDGTAQFQGDENCGKMSLDGGRRVGSVSYGWHRRLHSGWFRNLTLTERWSLSSSPWDLSTPDSVQKLQTALHAKAKAEPGYRFYALYDKISRDDILAHAYAQCRSNKGAPGVDRQAFRGGRGGWGRAMAGGTGACAQAGDLPTGSNQTRVHTEGQRQAQAAGHLNLAGSGLHDGSDAGAGTDLRSRPSLGTLCLPSRAKRPAGGGRGGGAGVSRPSGRGGRRPRGLLREHSPRRLAQVGSAPDRRSARAASDQDVAGLPRGRNRRSGPEDTHDRGARQAARHPAGLADLTLAGEYLYAPVRAGMEDVRARAKLGHAARDLRRRPRLDSGAKRNALKRSGYGHLFQARQARLGMAS